MTGFLLPDVYTTVKLFPGTQSYRELSFKSKWRGYFDCRLCTGGAVVYWFSVGKRMVL